MNPTNSIFTVFNMNTLKKTTYLLGVTLFLVVFCCGNAAQAQVINFDVPGGAGNGVDNYSGQGAVPDPGNNYWIPFVLDGTTPAGTYSDGVTPTPVTLTDHSVGVSFGLSGGAPGTPGALEWPWAYGYAPVTNTLNNVPAGTYNLYLYGKTADTGYPGGATFDVSVAGTDYGSQYTVNTYSSYCTVSNDFVAYHNVVVGVGGVITFSYAPPPERPSEGDWNGVQLVQITPPLVPVTLTNKWNGSTVTLSWPGSGLLLQATNLPGPWTTNNSATSPFVVTPTAPHMFYRLLEQ